MMNPTPETVYIKEEPREDWSQDNDGSGSPDKNQLCMADIPETSVFIKEEPNEDLIGQEYEEDRTREEEDDEEMEAYDCDYQRSIVYERSVVNIGDVKKVDNSNSKTERETKGQPISRIGIENYNKIVSNYEDFDNKVKVCDKRYSRKGRSVKNVFEKSKLNDQLCESTSSDVTIVTENNIKTATNEEDDPRNTLKSDTLEITLEIDTSNEVNAEDLFEDAWHDEINIENASEIITNTREGCSTSDSERGNPQNKLFPDERSTDMIIAENGGSDTISIDCEPAISHSDDVKIILPDVINSYDAKSYGGKSPVACLYCKKILSSLEKFHIHCKGFHPNMNQFQCELCRRFYATSEELKTHYWRSHRRTHSEKVFALSKLAGNFYKCSHCEKKFSEISLLRNHLTNNPSHMYAFGCSLCGRNFKSKMHLEKHLTRIHEKWRCERGGCHLKFACFEELLRHEKYAHGVGHVSCNTCGKHFEWKRHLNNHLPAHRNGRHFNCHLCSKGSCFSREALINHIRHFHS